jgi:hypothetical protein
MDDALKIIALGPHKGEARQIERGFRTLTRRVQPHWNEEYYKSDQAISKIRKNYLMEQSYGDYITYVPSHDGSLGPSEKFAFLLSELWEVPVKQILVRVKPIKSAYYSTVRPSKDQQNDSMEVIKNYDLCDKKIILVDNVIASGATIAAALSASVKGGYNFSSIYCLTIDERLFNKEIIEAILSSHRVYIKYIL